MPRITHAKDTNLDLDYGYMFDVQNHEELMDYWHKCRAAQISEGVKDALKALDGKGHVTTGYGSIIHMRVSVGGEGILQAVSLLEEELLTTMRKTLQECGRLLINTNGGYFSPHEHIEFIDSTEVKQYILPGAKPEITRWPGGVHWYAKV